MAKTVITTPVGEAIFPHLIEPNTRFNPDGVYEATVRLTATEAAELQAKVNKTVEPKMALLAAQNRFDPATVRRAASPFRPAVDRDKAAIPGYVDVRVKQARSVGHGEKKWTKEPELYDRYNRKWDRSIPILGGSTMRVCFEPSPYYVKGEVGITLRLIGVQVIDAVTDYRTPEAMGFSADPVEAAPVRTSDEDHALSESEFMELLKASTTS